MRLSIFSSEPLCSPTAIISVTRGGKIPLCVSGPESPLPSSTSLPAFLIASPMSILLTTLRTISIAARRGTPLCSRVASVREKRAMAIFRLTWPHTGILSFALSHMRLPASVPVVIYLKAAIAAARRIKISHQKDFKKLLIVIIIIVITGRV